jgi:hypothetical protein
VNHNWALRSKVPGVALALGQVFLHVLLPLFSSVSIILPLLHILSYILWGVDTGLIRGPVTWKLSLASS